MRCLPPKYDPKTTQSEEETNDRFIADHRNFYKVEKWTKDGTKIDRMLYAAAAWTRRGRLRRGDLSSATYAADHSAAHTRARAVAEGGCHSLAPTPCAFGQKITRRVAGLSPIVAALILRRGVGPRRHLDSRPGRVAEPLRFVAKGRWSADWLGRFRSLTPS